MLIAGGTNCSRYVGRPSLIGPDAVLGMGVAPNKRILSLAR